MLVTNLFMTSCKMLTFHVLKHFSCWILQKQCSGELLQKIILSYDHVHDEEALFRKCEGSISIVDKLEKEFCSDDKLGTCYVLSYLLQNV